MQTKAESGAVIIPPKDLVIPKYCESIHQTKRRPTRTIKVCIAAASPALPAHCEPCAYFSV